MWSRQMSAKLAMDQEHFTKAFIKALKDKEVAQVLQNTICSELRNEILELKEIIKDNDRRINQLEESIKDLKIEDNRQLCDDMAKLRMVVAGQQKYLEQVDTKIRAKNILVRGVPSGSWQHHDTDREKLDAIFTTMECNDVINYSFHRIGKAEGNRPQPILVEVDSNATRNRLVKSSPKLNKAGDLFKQIRIKKDQHPAIAKEWWRLFQAEKAAKDNPANAGCDIVLDRDSRQLLKDNVPIDAFQPVF